MSFENKPNDKKFARKDGDKKREFVKKDFKKDSDKSFNRFSRDGKPSFKGKSPRFDKSFDKKSDKRAPEYEYVPHTGFSAFQLRLVHSILNDVIVKHTSLDRAYAYWFKKVKIDAVEQGFIIRQINYMFSHLSYFAYVSGLKRPSDFERHVPRLTFSYCAFKGWTLPELEGEEGFDRRGLKKRIEEANEEPLLKDGCPLWLQELGYSELKEKWDEERRALGMEAHRFVRANTLKCSREQLAHDLSEEGIVTRPVAGAPLALEVTSNSALFRTRTFKEGKFEQQDAGSQLIGAFVEAKSGERVIDACAGSGGKTLQLAADMQGKGVIIAMDTEGWKLDDLKLFSLSVVSDSLQPHELQHARPPCPSSTPGVHSNSHPSSQ